MSTPESHLNDSLESSQGESISTAEQPVTSNETSTIN